MVLVPAEHGNKQLDGERARLLAELERAKQQVESVERRLRALPRVGGEPRCGEAAGGAPASPGAQGGLEPPVSATPLEPCSDGVWLLDRSFRFLPMSVASESLTERRQDELVGARVQDVFPDLQGSGFFALLSRVIESGRAEIWSGELTVDLGRTGCFEIRAHRVVDGLLCVCRDTTAWQLLTKVLAALSRSRVDPVCLQRILELISQALGVEDVAVRVKEQGGFPLFVAQGRAAGPAGSQKPLEQLACGPDLPPAIDCFCSQVLSGAGGSRLHFTPSGGFCHNRLTDELYPQQEATLRCRQAAFRSLALLPLRSQGELLGLLQVADRRPDRISPRSFELLERLAASLSVALARDRLEQALAESMVKLTATLESGLDSVFITRLRDHKIIEVNERFWQTHGFDRGSFRGSGPSSDEVWSAPADHERFLAMVKERGEMRNVEARLRHADGSIITYLLSATTLQLGGEDCVITIGRDITELRQVEHERRRLEAQLGRAQKLEAIGTLASGIAHDFNNILGTILGHAELARLDSDDPQLLSESLDQIAVGAQRAKELISQIMAFSRRPKAKMRRIALPQLLLETVRLLAGTLPATIRIEHFVDPKCEPVLADPSQIQQVIMNLCTNAFQAMEEYAKAPNESARDCVLSLRLEPVHILEGMPPDVPPLAGDHYVRLTVSDTGHGMSERQLSRIFEPYYTTRKKERGTGLGLAIAHGIITAHKGAVTVESRLGAGSSFHVYLPVSGDGAGEAATAKGAAVGASAQAARSILLVEDDAQLANLTKRMLERSGCRVTLCHHGLEALDVLGDGSRQFDILVTDHTMPKMTGLELARQAKSIRADIPVILITGYDEIAAQAERQDSGVTACLQKPFSPQELLTQVDIVSSEAKRRAH